MYTEMVSAAGLVRGDRKSVALCRILEQERPVALQLFGAEPEVMHQAAAIVAGMDNVDLIDINMGCPVRKIRRQGAGAALLEDPVLAAEVASAVVEGAGAKPVSVKLRLGPREDKLAEIVPGLVKAGVVAVCVHARTTAQGFGGQADWEAIKRLVGWCPVPVIGNGDVRSPWDARAMLETTGCAAVMIGRAAVGNPWIFAQALDVLAGREPRSVSVGERREVLKEHMALAERLGGGGHALHFVRQFMMHYTKGLPGAVAFRRRAGQARELGELWRLCEEFFAMQEEAGEG